jgi:transposase-like protein
MNEKRKKYSPTQKVTIVRELLEEGYSLSELSEKHRIHPSQLIRWKKQLFESAVETFSHRSKKDQKRSDNEMEHLRSRILHKDGIIAELLEENMKLKKNDGVY